MIQKKLIIFCLINCIVHPVLNECFEKLPFELQSSILKDCGSFGYDDPLEAQINSQKYTFKMPCMKPRTTQLFWFMLVVDKWFGPDQQEKQTNEYKLKYANAHEVLISGYCRLIENQFNDNGWHAAITALSVFRRLSNMSQSIIKKELISNFIIPAYVFSTVLSTDSYWIMRSKESDSSNLSHSQKISRLFPAIKIDNFVAKRRKIFKEEQIDISINRLRLLVLAFQGPSVGLHRFPDRHHYLIPEPASIHLLSVDFLFSLQILYRWPLYQYFHKSNFKMTNLDDITNDLIIKSETLCACYAAIKRESDSSFQVPALEFFKEQANAILHVHELEVDDLLLEYRK